MSLKKSKVPNIKLYDLKNIFAALNNGRMNRTISDKIKKETKKLQTNFTNNFEVRVIFRVKKIKPLFFKGYRNYTGAD